MIKNDSKHTTFYILLWILLFACICTKITLFNVVSVGFLIYNVYMIGKATLINVKFSNPKDPFTVNAYLLSIIIAINTFHINLTP